MSSISCCVYVHVFNAVFFMPLQPNECLLGLVFPSEVADIGAWEGLRSRSLEGFY